MPIERGAGSIQDGCSQRGQIEHEDDMELGVSYAGLDAGSISLPCELVWCLALCFFFGGEVIAQRVPECSTFPAPSDM